MEKNKTEPIVFKDRLIMVAALWLMVITKWVIILLNTLLLLVVFLKMIFSTKTTIKYVNHFNKYLK